MNFKTKILVPKESAHRVLKEFIKTYMGCMYFTQFACKCTDETSEVYFSANFYSSKFVRNSVTQNYIIKN